MVRNMMTDGGYDAIIADIRLPDMSGYQFMLKLQEIIDVDPLPLILMTGFGYDPGHSIVKARQAGVQSVLYKPFRLDMLWTPWKAWSARPAPRPSRDELPVMAFVVFLILVGHTFFWVCAVNWLHSTAIPYRTGKRHHRGLLFADGLGADGNGDRVLAFGLELV